MNNNTLAIRALEHYMEMLDSAVQRTWTLAVAYRDEAGKMQTATIGSVEPGPRGEARQATYGLLINRGIRELPDNHYCLLAVRHPKAGGIHLSVDDPGWSTATRDVHILATWQHERGMWLESYGQPRADDIPNFVQVDLQISQVMMGLERSTIDLFERWVTHPIAKTVEQASAWLEQFADNPEYRDASSHHNGLSASWIASSCGAQDVLELDKFRESWRKKVQSLIRQLPEWATRYDFQAELDQMAREQGYNPGQVSVLEVIRQHSIVSSHTYTYWILLMTPDGLAAVNIYGGFLTTPAFQGTDRIYRTWYGISNDKFIGRSSHRNAIDTYVKQWLKREGHLSKTGYAIHRVSSHGGKHFADYHVHFFTLGIIIRVYSRDLIYDRLYIATGQGDCDTVGDRGDHLHPATYRLETATDCR